MKQKGSWGGCSRDDGTSRSFSSARLTI